MNNDNRKFVEQDFIALLRNADPATTPAWGRMGFQQMVEHLVLTMKNANGKMKTAVMLTPDDKVAAFQDFIRSDKAFRENTKSPAFPEDPLPLHFPTVSAAIDKLEREIQDFFAAYDADPALTIRNPVFGDLDYELSVTLLHKHFRHHATQFRLI